MTKKEWQNKHGFSDKDMDLIDFTVKLFEGKIACIEDKKK